MVKLEMKLVLVAIIIAFCLLAVSNYVGNTLIPPFSPNYSTKSISYKWIKWPEPKHSISISKNDQGIDIKTPETNASATVPITNDDKNAKTSGSELSPPSQKKTLALLLTSVDSTAGKKVARKCVACHTFKKGGKNKIGPNLYGVMSRNRGTVPEYNYSKALKKMGGKWNFTDMDKFLKNPKLFLPGTKMAFKGIKKPTDRAVILIYLNDFSDTPLPFTKID